MVIKKDIVDILVKRIRRNSINPVTGTIFKIEDIKIQEYRTAVEDIINLK